MKKLTLLLFVFLFVNFVYAKTTVPTGCKSTCFSYGMQSENIKLMQQQMNAIMGTNIKVDGKFGRETLDLVKKFQSKFDLSKDGVCGDQCKAELKEQLDAKTKADLEKTIPPPSSVIPEAVKKGETEPPAPRPVEGKPEVTPEENILPESEWNQDTNPIKKEYGMYDYDVFKEDVLSQGGSNIDALRSWRSMLKSAEAVAKGDDKENLRNEIKDFDNQINEYYSQGDVAGGLIPGIEYPRTTSQLDQNIPPDNNVVQNLQNRESDLNKKYQDLNNKCSVYDCTNDEFNDLKTLGKELNDIRAQIDRELTKSGNEKANELFQKQDKLEKELADAEKEQKKLQDIYDEINDECKKGGCDPDRLQDLNTLDQEIRAAEERTRLAQEALGENYGYGPAESKDFFTTLQEDLSQKFSVISDAFSDILFRSAPSNVFQGSGNRNDLDTPYYSYYAKNYDGDHLTDLQEEDHENRLNNESADAASNFFGSETGANKTGGFVFPEQRLPNEGLGEYSGPGTVTVLPSRNYDYDPQNNEAGNLLKGPANETFLDKVLRGIEEKFGVKPEAKPEPAAPPSETPPPTRPSSPSTPKELSEAESKELFGGKYKSGAYDEKDPGLLAKQAALQEEIAKKAEPVFDKDAGVKEARSKLEEAQKREEEGKAGPDEVAKAYEDLKLAEEKAIKSNPELSKLKAEEEKIASRIDEIYEKVTPRPETTPPASEPPSTPSGAPLTNAEVDEGLKTEGKEPSKTYKCFYDGTKWMQAVNKGVSVNTLVKGKSAPGILLLKSGSKMPSAGDSTVEKGGVELSTKNYKVADECEPDGPGKLKPKGEPKDVKYFETKAGIKKWGPLLTH